MLDKLFQPVKIIASEVTMEKYITLDQAAEITGFSRVTLWRHVKAGRLKCCKPKHSNAIRFTRRQIEDFMSSGSPAEPETA